MTSPWEPKVKDIKTLAQVHQEFDTTFGELAARTDVDTALHGIAFTVAGRAFATSDPIAALNEFKLILNHCYNCINRSIREGSWKPPSGI